MNAWVSISCKGELLHIMEKFSVCNYPMQVRVYISVITSVYIVSYNIGVYVTLTPGE